MRVIGHRGAAGEAPENTIAGCRHAIGRGVRHFEIDLRLAADDELVVIHDTTTLRTTGVRGAIGKHTAAALRKLDARRDAPPWPRRTGVPTLRALLKAMPAARSFQLEVKGGRRKTMQRIAEQLALMFPDRRAGRRVTVTSIDNYLLECVRDAAPHLRRGHVCLETTALKLLEPLGCELAPIHYSLATPERVAELHAAGLEVSCWTVNDPPNIIALHGMGVDSVITDYPSMALPLVARLNVKTLKTRSKR